MADFAAGALLSLLTFALATSLHYEGLRILEKLHSGKFSPVIVLTAVAAIHFANIVLYATAYVVLAAWSDASFSGTRGPLTLPDYLYFAAETYSTLGYGDIVPTGVLRLLAGVESLNGLLLLAWSGAFVFRLVEDSK